jgi:serine/threonine protein kinase
VIGTRLDKYDLLEKIGEGGMATVYRASHTTLKREVAVKVLHPHLSSALKNRQRFAREARTIEALRHDGILRIFDYSGEDADQCYIVTELIRGDTLKDFLQKRGLLPSELVALMGIKIAQGLAFAHAAGVVHRDIKPENVMIREDGVIKLMDFGIARFLEESAITMTGSLIGSPAYMSPEQVLERTPDTRSDIFSLGAMLFNLVTGHRAFPGLNPSVILKKVIEGDHARVLDLQPSVAPDLAVLIEQMLSPSPGDRPSDAQEVVVRMQQFLEEMAIGEENIAWSLERFTADPEAYENQLNEHLSRHLLAHGQKAIERGDHATARSDFNRLLALEPDHPEVMEMIADLAFAGNGQSLHSTLARWGGLVVLIVAIPGIWIWSQSSTETKIATVKEVASIARPVSQSLTPETVQDRHVLPIVTPDLPAPKAIGNEKETTPKPVIVSKPKETLTVEERPIASQEVVSQEVASQEVVSQEVVKPPPQPPLDRGVLHVGLSKLTQGVWADVFVDGQSKGRTRGGSAPLRIEMTPGPHVLKVTNDYALAFERRFELDAGQSVRFDDISLQKRPVTLQFQPNLAPECIVLLQEKSLGTLGALGFQSSISNPRDLSKLHIRCPDGKLHGPFDMTTPSPGDIVRFPPKP